MLCSGDIEMNSGTKMWYEYFFKASEDDKSKLRFVHLNFQDVSKEHTQLKPFINHMDKIATL